MKYQSSLGRRVITGGSESPGPRERPEERIAELVAPVNENEIGQLIKSFKIQLQDLMT